MLQKRMFCRQSFIADSAGVRPFSSVHPLMDLKRMLLGKAFATLAAFKRALP